MNDVHLCTTVPGNTKLAGCNIKGCAAIATHTDVFHAYIPVSFMRYLSHAMLSVFPH